MQLPALPEGASAIERIGISAVAFLLLMAAMWLASKAAAKYFTTRLDKKDLEVQEAHQRERQAADERREELRELLQQRHEDFQRVEKIMETQTRAFEEVRRSLSVIATRLERQ